MYTGLVETTAAVAAVDRLENGCRIRIETGTDHDLDLAIAPEDSIAVDGVCVTAERVTDDWFEAFLSAETVSRTRLDEREPGDRVNLERPLPADGRFHGHLVKGTVDTTTTVLAVDESEEGGEDVKLDTGDERATGGRNLTLEIPANYEQYVVEKGAVALDGISLTVAGVDDDAGTFDIATVPTTEAVTTLSERRPGDRLHFEADVLAKYAARRETLTG
ncbi:riboflavin synthase [Halobacteria archaeon AArc-m2/3/4]|uniref:Riboflavin synthase n=1 Tax=Natronoglomus mannanivorans TaxID=2979990 RepID=A0ABT2QBX4_9EURY|nr:riboflavin synthase [Halobacteria archaeon AArc-m2/3/4]